MRHALADLEGAVTTPLKIQKLKKSDRAKQKTEEMKR